MLIDRQIEEMDAVCRYVSGARRSRRRAYIAFDEWNVWYRTRNAQGMKRGGAFPMPLIEEVYDLQDALVVAQFLLSFIRHADVVKVANLAQVCNVIAPILTRGDELLRQTIFHALTMFRDCRSGRSLRVGYDGPKVAGPLDGPVDMVDAAVVLDGNRACGYAVNRSVDVTLDLTIDLADGRAGQVVDARLLSGDDPTAANTWERPDVITAAQTDRVRIIDGQARLELPPMSFIACTLTLED